MTEVLTTEAFNDSNGVLQGRVGGQDNVPRGGNRYGISMAGFPKIGGDNSKKDL